MFAADFTFQNDLYTCTFELESYSDCFVVIVHLVDGNLKRITGVNPFTLKYSVDMLVAQWPINSQDCKLEKGLKSIISEAVKIKFG